MKSLKDLKVKGMLGKLGKKANGASSPAGSVPNDDPVLTAKNSVKAFCESGNNNKGDEVLFLPPIVDAAESSPAAAAECARVIRKFMSKDYNSRPSWQYNAIMLVRILTDNPGETFTRNLDDKFVDTARQMLKSSKENKIRNLLMETLDDFEHTKMYDENLRPLVLMWQEEKTKALEKHGGRLPPSQPPRMLQQPMFSPPSRTNGRSDSANYFSRHHTNHKLPKPEELAGRLEEARTSAKLLEQVVMNTPPDEFLHNELIKEFADRCLSASRSIQGYMHAEDPSPDNETMETLIDTNEQLQTALHQHQRAVLSARKTLGLGERQETDLLDDGETNGFGGGDSPGQDEYRDKRNGKGKAAEGYPPPSGPPPRSGSFGADNLPPALASGSGSRPGYQDDHSPRPPTKDKDSDDPFADPGDQESHAIASGALHSEEPFHPGGHSYSPQDEDKGLLGGGSTARNDDHDDDDLYEASSHH